MAIVGDMIMMVGIDQHILTRIGSFGPKQITTQNSIILSPYFSYHIGQNNSGVPKKKNILLTS